MRKTVIAIIVLMAVSLIAQSANQFSMVTPNAAVTGCPAPVAGSNILCSVTDGYYVSISGGAYAKINVGSSQSGVVTFNGRSGNVTPTANDYSYSQLSGLPTTISCAVSSQSNSGFTASGCTIK